MYKNFYALQFISVCSKPYSSIAGISVKVLTTFTGTGKTLLLRWSMKRTLAPQGGCHDLNISEWSQMIDCDKRWSNLECDINAIDIACL